jgi:uncharacterized repeat protein (TIGR01451 family)
MITAAERGYPEYLTQAHRPFTGVVDCRVRVWKPGKGLGRFALTSCAVALLLAGLSGSALATFPGLRGKIVFVAGDGALDTVNADGTGLTELQGHNSFDNLRHDPAWSPDGRYIAWAEVADPDLSPDLTDIGVIDAETGDWHWLTTSGRELRGESYAPTWTGDGDVLFTYIDRDQAGRGPPSGTYVAHVEGGLPYLYKAGPETRADLAPAGGFRAAYVRDEALYVSDEDLLNGTQVADGPILDFDWSPDGRRIAYTTYLSDDVRDAHVWIVDADGTNAHELATGSGPSWSPDGAKIVFATREGLVIIDLSGTGLHYVVNQATGKNVQGLWPDWQPVHPTAATAPTEPLSADMGVTAVGEPTELRVGEQVTYTATVTNHGPGTAVDVVLSVDLPDGLSSVVVSSTAGSCSSIRPVACRLGTLTRSQTATVTLKATAAAAGTSSLTFAVGASVSDPNVGDNNRVTVSTNVSALSATRCTIRGPERSDTLVGTSGPDQGNGAKRHARRHVGA